MYARRCLSRASLICVVIILVVRAAGVFVHEQRRPDHDEVRLVIGTPGCRGQPGVDPRSVPDGIIGRQ